MMKTLHVGCTARELFNLTRAATSLGLPDATIHGDGWECWGEPLGEDVNDKKTLHVMFSAEEIRGDVVVRLNALANLISMAVKRQSGVYASVTSFEDWSEELISFRRPSEGAAA